MGILGEGAKGRAIDAVAKNREAKSKSKSSAVSLKPISKQGTQVQQASTLIDALENRSKSTTNNNETDEHTFEYYVRDASKITLFDLKGSPRTLTSKDEMAELIRKLRRSMIVKQFFGKHALQDFKREYMAYRILYKIYGADGLKQYTSTHTIDLGNRSYIGAELDGSYFIFNSKCQSTLEDIPTNKVTRKYLRRMVFDILTSLSILQSNNSGHFDIKPDNIMYCKSRGQGKFKLIDWDLSHSTKSHTNRYWGSRTFTSPISWILGKYNMNLIYGPFHRHASINFGTSVYARTQHKDVFSHPELKHFVKVSTKFYKELISEYNGNDKQLFEEYKFTLDLYNFGMTILFLAAKHNILEKADDVVAFAQNMVLAKYKDAKSALQAAETLLIPLKDTKSA